MSTTARLGVDIVAVDRSRAAFDSFTRSVRQAEIGNQRFAATSNAAFMSFGRGLASIGAAFGITFGAGALAAFAKSAISDLAAIKDQAERAGLSIEQMQSLTFVARQGGGDQNDIVDIFQKMDRALAEARRGIGDLGPILDANNIKLTDATGIARDHKAVFLDIVNLIAGAGDEIDRSRILQAAFGRSAEDSLPFLKDGAEAIRQGEAAAHRVGVVIDTEVVQAAARFDDAWTATWDSWMAHAKAAVVYWADNTGDVKYLSMDGTIATQNERDITQNQRDRATAIEEQARAQERLNVAAAAGAPPVEIEELNAQLAEAAKRLSAVQRGLSNLDNGGDRHPGPGAYFRQANMPATSDSGASRETSTGKIRAERDAVGELITRLEFERSLINMTSAEREVATNLRQAGASATAQQTAEITRLTTAMAGEQQTQRLLEAGAAAAAEFGRSVTEASAKPMEDLGASIRDNLMTNIDALTAGTMRAKDAFRAMGLSIIQDLSRIALQMAFSGIGSLFSGGVAPSQQGGGIFGALLKGFAGGFADGGSIPAGQWGVAGERGPELLMGPATVFPTGTAPGQPGGGGVINYAPTINTTSGDGSQIKALLDQQYRQFKAQLPAMLREARVRSAV